MRSLSDLIAKFADKDCGTGASPEAISSIERSLGVSLPRSYRLFLARYGWARFSYQEIYGIGNDVPIQLDLARNVEAERFIMQPAMSSHLIPVMNDGSGNHYCLDTSKHTGIECPVVFWDHEQSEEQIPQVVAANFDEWLSSKLLDLS